MEFIDSEKSNDLLLNLNELRENHQLCDIELIVPGIDESESIPAHKNILAASSTYFNVMFNGVFDDSKKSIILMKDLQYDALKSIIEYFYTGSIQIHQENVQNLLSAASFLQLSWIQDQCCYFLEKSLDSVNCLGIKFFADRHSCLKLSNETIKFISKNFQDISTTEEFLALTYEQLYEILSNDEIFENLDGIVYDCIMKWVKHSIEIRKKHLPILINFLHPALVDKKSVENSDLIQNNRDCDDWKNKVLSVEGEYQNNIFILDKIGKTSELAKFEMSSRDIVQLAPLPEKAFAVSFVGYKNFLYVLGGQSNPKRSRTTSYYYNIYRNRWLSLTPLLSPRSHHRSCILDGNFLYSIGGNGFCGQMNGCECLDLSIGNAFEIRGMLNERRSMAATSYDGNLYVMGGEDDRKCLYSMERYDPRIGSWHQLASMTQVNSYCSSAIIDGSIYCTEGLGNCLERYDFRMDNWEIIDLQEEREFYELFAIDNNLYAISGSEIARYTPNDNDWINVLKFDKCHEWDTAIALKMQIL